MARIKQMNQDDKLQAMNNDFFKAIKDVEEKKNKKSKDSKDKK